MENQYKEEDCIDLKVLLIDMIRGVQKYWYGFLILILLSTAAFWYYMHASYVPRYRAEASFTVKMVRGNAQNEVSTSYSFYYDKDTANQVGATFPYLLGSDVFQTRLKEYLGCNVINGSISAQVIENSNLVTLSVTSLDRETAMQILDGVIEVYPDVAQYVLGSTKLEMIEAPEASEEPYNTWKLLPTLIKGIGLGLACSICLLAVYALFRKTIRQESDLKKILNVPCLAQVPELRKHGASDSGYSRMRNVYTETFFALQNRIEYLMKKNGMQVLAVTSTGPAEGKSTVSVDLARAMAKSGRRVCLIDGDLRKPDLKKRLHMEENDASLMNVIKKQASLEESLIQAEENLLFLGSGKPVQNSVRIIQSREMKTLISDVKKYADVIIIDTPPCAMLTDAGCYAECADAFLYVVRQDWTDGRQMMNAVDDFPEHGKKIVGCVLNRVRMGLVNYDGYSYGYYYKNYKYYGRSKYEAGPHSGLLSEHHNRNGASE